MTLCPGAQADLIVLAMLTWPGHAVVVVSHAAWHGIGHLNMLRGTVLAGAWDWYSIIDGFFSHLLSFIVCIILHAMLEMVGEGWGREGRKRRILKEYQEQPDDNSP